MAALALTKIGCGSAWQGYYMYQGGSHVMEAATTMQESFDTGYPNDVPIVSYDFQAPLGEPPPRRAQLTGLLSGTQVQTLSAGGSWPCVR